MNWDALIQRLVGAARHSPPSDAVPYTFEKRVMARVRSQHEASAGGSHRASIHNWPAVTRALWWAAGACTAIAVTMGAWTFAPESASENFSDELEDTILAAVNEADPAVDLDIPW
jgi:hypothetical protein